MAINKVVYGTTVLVDLTEDTVTESSLQQGYTAHSKNGVRVTGTLIKPSGTLTLTSNTSGVNCAEYETVVVAVPEYDGSVG